MELELRSQVIKQTFFHQVSLPPVSIYRLEKLLIHATTQWTSKLERWMTDKWLSRMTGGTRLREGSTEEVCDD